MVRAHHIILQKGANGLRFIGLLIHTNASGPHDMGASVTGQKSHDSNCRLKKKTRRSKQLEANSDRRCPEAGSRVRVGAWATRKCAYLCVS
ncbi:hypothetical protein HPB50_026129 [Hyalomma asiaticum]|uniref:Uncharacterized protein n=1 Tax=Hyalomma asiaticum TaxID=266040 RepID=A0ACB7SAH7_HYAAI|nr:hypothetical protein HPB50_026129 [Hyalomma asiaticum]